MGGLTPASGLDVYLAGTFLIRRFRAVIRISRGSMSLKVKNPVVAEGQSQKHGSESQAYGLLAAGPGPSSSVHGILQARILEWVAISSSRGSSRLKDQT